MYTYNNVLAEILYIMLCEGVQDEKICDMSAIAADNYHKWECLQIQVFGLANE